MQSYKSSLKATVCLRASDGFADRVMERIDEERIRPGSVFVYRLRFAGMAAMFILCVSVGVLIGSGHAMSDRFGQKENSLKEFQEIHNLYSVPEKTFFFYEI